MVVISLEMFGQLHSSSILSSWLLAAAYVLSFFLSDLIVVFVLKTHITFEVIQASKYTY